MSITSQSMRHFCSIIVLLAVALATSPKTDAQGNMPSEVDISIKTVIDDWVAAWSAKDVRRYLSHYSPNFVSQTGLNIEQWGSQRAPRLTAPEWIRVTVSDIRIEALGEDVRAEFRQDYTAPHYSNTKVKGIIFEWDDSRWKIVEEQSLEAFSIDASIASIRNEGLIEEKSLDTEPVENAVLLEPSPITGFGQPPLTLSGAILAAYEHVPNIAAQEHFVAASEQQIKLAKSSRRPNILIDGSKTYAEYDNNATRSEGFSGYIDNSSDRVDLVLSQRIYDQGATRNQVAEAQHLHDSEALILSDTKEKLAAEVISVYIDVLRYQALWDAAKRNVSIGEELDSVIRNQVDAGHSAEVDEHLSSSQLASINSQVDVQYGLLANARIRFFKLTGLEASNLEGVNPLSDFIRMDGSQNPNLLTSVITERPDIQAAQSRVEAARASVKSHKGNLFPAIDLEFFAGQGGDEEYVFGDNNSYGVNLAFNWDLYDGGAGRAELAQSRSQLSAEMSGLDELLRTATRDTMAALVALSSTEKQLSHLKIEQVANKAVYEAYQEQLITGRRSPLDVFVVLNNYNQSTLRSIDVHYQVIAEQYEVIANYGKLSQFIGL